MFESLFFVKGWYKGRYPNNILQMDICPGTSLGLSHAVCGSYFKSFGYPCHAHRGPRAKRLGGKNTNQCYTLRQPPAGDPQSIPLSLYTSCPLSLGGSKQQTNAVIVVVGGRNNRDLVTLQKNYLRGIHFIQKAAQLQCIKR